MVAEAELRAAIRAQASRLRKRMLEIGPLANLQDDGARASARLLRVLLRAAGQATKPEQQWRFLQAAATEAANVRLLNEAVPAMEQRNRSAKRSRDNARKPRRQRRSEVTKQALIDFRRSFDEANGTTRGWVKAACLKFRTTSNTIKKRMT